MASVLHFSYINLFYARTRVNPQLLFENLLINVPISLFGTLSCFFLYRYVSCHLRFQCLLVQTSKKIHSEKKSEFFFRYEFLVSFTSKNESESRHKKQILVHTVAFTIQSLMAWLILFLGQCGR